MSFDGDVMPSTPSCEGDMFCSGEFIPPGLKTPDGEGVPPTPAARMLQRRRGGNKESVSVQWFSKQRLPQ
eukprot:35060-Eustigmatos_ZCMA.PRE.1